MTFNFWDICSLFSLDICNVTTTAATSIFVLAQIGTILAGLYATAQVVSLLFPDLFPFLWKKRYGYLWLKKQFLELHPVKVWKFGSREVRARKSRPLHSYLDRFCEIFDDCDEYSYNEIRDELYEIDQGIRHRTELEFTKLRKFTAIVINETEKGGERRIGRAGRSLFREKFHELYPEYNRDRY